MIADDTDPAAQACVRLVYRAALYTDHGRWEELADLFVQDGRLVRPSDPSPIVGRANILTSLRARPARTTRHLLGNVLVEMHSATRARIDSTVTLFSGPAPTADAAATGGPGVGAALPVPGQAIMVGNFEDEVALTAQGWRFLVRGGSMALKFERAP
ncbi:MAG: nuclear transport factor 2 family protein [Steroidobacteraceae bacterium]